MVSSYEDDIKNFIKVYSDDVDRINNTLKLENKNHFYINKHNFIELITNNHKAKKQLLLLIAFLKLIPKNVLEHCILYSGAALLLYGTTYTKDVDLIFYDMTKEDLETSLKDIKGIRKIDICYEVSIDKYSLYNKFIDFSTNKMHHNSDILNALDGKFKKAIFNINNINVFNPLILKQFYEHRFNMTRINTKHYILIDFYNLYTNNNFPKFFISKYYDINDLKKFIFYMNEYNIKNIKTYDEANKIISQISNATLKIPRFKYQYKND